MYKCFAVSLPEGFVGVVHVTIDECSWPVARTKRAFPYRMNGGTPMPDAENKAKQKALQAARKLALKLAQKAAR